MGIEAHPVLVHSQNRETVDGWAPAPYYAFNHVVAQGEAGWKNALVRSHVYLPARLIETNIYFPDYCRGLVVAPDSFDLVKEIPTQTAGFPVTTVTETFRVFSYTNAVRNADRIIKQGADADGMRATLSQTTKEELEKSYLNHYARVYPTQSKRHSRWKSATTRKKMKSSFFRIT